MDSMSREDYTIHVVSPTATTWTGVPHVAAVFRHEGTEKFMAILLGRCESHLEAGSGRLGAHWAAVAFYASDDHGPGPKFQSYEHACPGDHVGSDSTIRVRDPHLPASPWDPPGATSCWRLSFAPCPIDPSETLIVNVDLLEVHARYCTR